MAGSAPASTTPPPASQTPGERYVSVMKALGDPTRLDMIRLIASEREYPCTSLESFLPVGKSTISYHVKILSQAGLISVRREGRFFFYALHRDTLDHFAPNLLDDLGRSRP